MFDPGGAWSCKEVFVPRDGLQVSFWAADQDVRDQPGLPGSSQVIIKQPHFKSMVIDIHKDTYQGLLLVIKLKFS